MKTNTSNNLKFLKLLFIVITLSTFNSISAQERDSFPPAGEIRVYRGGNLVNVTPITYTQNLYKLVVYQGDKVIFRADPSSNPSVSGLTDTNVMRWAGECLFMENEIPYQGAPKPFLIFDSNVHGVKKRRYPESWANGRHLYPEFVQSSEAHVELTWFANGRYELPSVMPPSTLSTYNINNYLKSYKEKPDGSIFENFNKFFGLNVQRVISKFQRNNQREGLNMELLDANRKNMNYVAGLDPDELIYNNLNDSRIVGNGFSTGLKFDYVLNDQWKNISSDQRKGINASMYQFLNETKKITDPKDNYSGHEIVDENLYTFKNGSTIIEGKTFNYEIAQPMFNNKRPVYYNPIIGNKPLIKNKTLQFSLNGRISNIQLAVLSPLEGNRIGKYYTKLSETDRKNPKVNFYGIIDGPIHVARFQRAVKYTVRGLPKRDATEGEFYLVYTYEDTYGIIQEQRKEVYGEVPYATFNIQGGGFHDLTLRFKGYYASSDDEVIIAGKELIDIDLRFIFSPENITNSDFSYNPTSTLKGTVKLNENKGNGERWFLGDNNPKLIANNYGLNHGYEDQQVVRTYTLDRDDTMTLTVLDADPHAFVHWQPDFYLSERRLSKRLTTADLESPNDHAKIEWFVAKDANFILDKKSVGSGRYFTVSPKSIWPGGWFTGAYKGSFYLKAVYNNTSEISVKIVQKEVTGTIDKIINTPGQNLGGLQITTLTDDQFKLLHDIAPTFYKTGTLYGKTRYLIYKVKDILSAYTYGETQVGQTRIAKRYDDVGEHKRFSDMNNYECRFNWEFKNPGTKAVINNSVLFYDFDNFNEKSSYYKYVTLYQKKWFPKYWVRHLDSKNLSGEIPEDGDSRLRVFPKTSSNSLSTYNNGAVPYEPWQVRLPWIVQTGLQGYRTRWNIKCIYDVKKLFAADQIGKAYSVSADANTYANNVLGNEGSKILPGFDADKRELQEFYHMLKNKEIVVVDAKKLDSIIRDPVFTVNIRVEDRGFNKIYEGLHNIANVLPGKLAQSKNEASLPINDNGSLCMVYPNPNSVGIFSIDINVPQENSSVDLQLSDLNGRVIYNSLPKVVSGRYSTTIGENLNLPKGVYLLTLKINELIETKKLIVD